MSDANPEGMAAGEAPGAQHAEPDRLRLGGMALRNGLLIHGPTAWAVAARAPDGSIEVASGSKPTLARGRLGRLPFVRGPLRLAEAVAVIPVARRRLRSARLPFEDPRVIAVGVATAMAGRALRRRRSVAGEAATAILGVLPALTALRDRDLAAYHGVEHKAIGAYERGMDPAEVPKEHERCGSNLLAPMIAMSVTGQAVLAQLLEQPGPLARAAAGVAGVGGAVELFAYAERHPGSPLGRAVHGPGHEIQRLVSTKEPTPEQLEVGEAALEAILREEGVQLKSAATTADTNQGSHLPAEGPCP